MASRWVTLQYLTPEGSLRMEFTPFLRDLPVAMSDMIPTDMFQVASQTKCTYLIPLPKGLCLEENKLAHYW